MKICIFFVRYGEDEYTDSLKELLNYLSSWSCKFVIYVIENNINFQIKESNIIFNKNIKIHFLYGDNSFREFSAWTKAISLIENYFDYFIFMTSAYSKDYKGGNWNLLHQLSVKLFDVEGNSVIGNIDSANLNFSTIFGNFNTWIRSSLFILPSASFSKINTMIFFDNTDYLNWDLSIFNSNLKISKNLQNHIQNWLSGYEINSGNYYGYGKYSINFNDYSLKYKTIINEFLFSQFLRENQFNFIDLTLLNNNLFKNGYNEYDQYKVRLKNFPES
jgi:hypothetical protein